MKETPKNSQQNQKDHRKPVRRADGRETVPAIFPGKEKEHDPSRRRFLKKASKFALTASAGIFTGGYAWLWEPRRLEVEHVELRLPRLPKAFQGMKIAHFSDMHLGFHMDVSDMERLASALERQSPDLICFTGDMLEGRAEPMRECIPLLKAMKAPLGKYAVLGNHDYRGREYERLAQMYREAGFTLLVNKHVTVERAGERMAIVGLDDALNGVPDPELARKGLSKGTFALLLMHEPDYADFAKEYDYDLQLSGHSHGGQVRAPFFGALTTPRGSQKYIQGLYYTGEEGSSMPVYVNRGVGMTQLPIRFLCRPELTIFHV
ncbi:metallophosphoesterase [Paenibacillus sp. Marseille-Q4541]|uniref:metallophosphoesterase n=1 Tax=Paenibacillus sp. Marseille-Q4541 TaxID=2831522 RepID=UPI001BA666C8|nr:metallophosphoesterase [Paenibacillus sp. Marseille-Q4541]